MTGHNQQQAEDLVHDAFIQFTLARPDLSTIQNLEGYLYVTLRNMHLSQMRRAVRNQSLPLSLVDYDSAEATLRAVDTSAQLQAKDELRAICQYACARKDTSKSGSVLILRFFHGYYPGEIAQIMAGPRRAVDDWLRIARREAKLYLENPRRLDLLRDTASTGVVQISAEQTTQTFLTELRAMIFRSRSGQCLPLEQLTGLYRATEAEPIDSAVLAHIVSCQRCLDEVNNRLGFPPLADRFPTDMLGPDAPAKGQKNGRATNGDARTRLHRRATETFEHHPKELRVSANGFIVGSQTISAEQSEQRLSINLGEPLGFIEVFSEQGVRLLFSTIEPPPDGPVNQDAHVELSDERTLDLCLSFCDAWPQAHITYCDPLLNSAHAVVAESVTESESVAAQSIAQPLRLAQAARVAAISPRRSWLASIKQGLAATGFLLQPGMITVIVALLLIAALLLVRIGPTPVSADELLRRASRSEETTARKPDHITHRVFNYEERRAPEGTLVARRKVELWSNTEQAVTVRRLYDEAGQLMAGAWKNPDGSQTIYHRGAKPKIEPAPAQQSTPVIDLGNLWLLEPSAKDFATLIGNLDAAKVEEQPAAYFISYQARAATGEQAKPIDGFKIVQATLRLNQTDLHALELTLMTRNSDGSSAGAMQYRFTESNFEQRPSQSVAPEVFQPEIELLNPAISRTMKPTVREEFATDPVPTAAEPARLGAAAMANLEVEALYQLHRTGACLHDQVNLTRTADGQLQIQAIVDTEKRKAELLSALNSVANVPGVQIELNTVAEALRQQIHLPTAPAAARRVEIRKDQIPVYADLRQYFSGKSASDGATPDKQPANNAIDERVRNFAKRALNHSRQMLLQAWSLKRLVEQLSPDGLHLLGGEALAKWRSMARDHARALEGESEALRLELQPIFFASLPSLEARVGEATDVGRAIQRLFELAAQNEQAVRLAFSVTAEGTNFSVINTAEFRDALANAD